VLHRLPRHADVQLQRSLEAGLEKTGVFKKNQPSRFFGFFGVFFFYKYIFAQKTEFLGFFFQFQEYF